MARPPKKIVKVEGSSTLVRDMESRAIINTDKTGLHAARALKQKMKDQLTHGDKIASLEERILSLETQLQQVLSVVENLNTSK